MNRRAGKPREVMWELWERKIEKLHIRLEKERELRRGLREEIKALTKQIEHLEHTLKGVER